MRNEGGAIESSEGSLRTFGQLLDEKEELLTEILGADELETIWQEKFSDENSLDINPEFASREKLRDYWKNVVSNFAKNDASISLNRGYQVEQRAQSLIQGLFNPLNKTGLSILMVGCYHIDLFNRDDVVAATKSFLDNTRAEEFLLITASSEEVMYAEVEQGKCENKFLQLITQKVYADRVFPIKLPERPEFHFSGRLSMPRQNGSDTRCFLGFETHHYEGDEIRARVESKVEANFRFAFRSFARYVVNPIRSFQCVVERNLKLYKKYLPQFFLVYRQLPPYLQKHVRIDFGSAE